MVTCIAPMVMLCIAKRETRSQFSAFPSHTTGSQAFCWGSSLGPLRHWGRPSTGEGDQKAATSTICWAAVHIPMLSNVPSGWWCLLSFYWRALPVEALVEQAEHLQLLPMTGSHLLPQWARKYWFPHQVAEQSHSLIEKSHYSYQILQSCSINTGDNPITCYF